MAGWGAFNVFHPGPSAALAVAWQRWMRKRMPWGDPGFEILTDQRAWEMLTRCLGALFFLVGLGLASGWLFRHL
jgi:hypothetical protein